MKEKLDNYFLGELSDSEKSDLFDKIESDENYKTEYIRVQNTVTLSNLYSQKGDSEWAGQMMEELDNKIKRKKGRQIFRQFTKYAAIIILLLGNAWWLSEKIIPKQQEIVYTKIEVPKGQRVYMTLMDGTEVWLSPRSTIKIPNKFSKKERSVELDGEGFFSVVKEIDRSFVVKTKEHNIKVLGTRFNVFAYSESERFETDLLEGKIEVMARNNPSAAVILHPGEKVIWKENQLIKSISYFNNEEYLKNGIFSFSNKPFKEILDYLSLWYNVKFDVQKEEAEPLVSGKFRQSDEVISILKGLQGVHPFKYKIITDEKIEIY